MNYLEVLAVAAGLGMDAMSVSMGVGVRWHGARQKFRLAWHMGLFQFLMPIGGWLAGKTLADALAGIGTYLAAALVIAVGAKMLYEALRGRPGALAEKAEHAAEKELRVHPRDPTRGWSLVALSIATSLDALVVGFSLGLKGHNILLTATVIGVVAAAMSLAGVVIGKRAGEIFGRPAEIFGALILIALGASFPWL